MDSLQILPSRSLLQGAVVFDDGVNFTIFSRGARAVFLHLFENSCDGESFFCAKIDQTYKTGDLWSVFVRGLRAGALYLYKVDGEFDPKNGKWFDGSRFLFDPYAKAFTEGSIFSNLSWHDKKCPLEKMPKCVVVDDADYDWGGDKLLKIPLQDSVIYETHLRGFTILDDSLEACERGTFKGLEKKIPYLKSLGVTAIELLPIHEFDENENSRTNPKTGERLKNFWGYSTIGFFAPKMSYAANKSPGAVVREFKDMVKAFHAAGIEVLLDVVFNHTAEGNEHGVSMNFRGLQNDVYYHLIPEHKEYYANFSGCGNALNCNHPVVREYIISCLRYWVSQMHVDGFRFDLASVFTRSQEGQVLKFPPIANAISEDPILSDAKIIAEPWDCCGAYHTGNFPGGRWCEWNDKFRDSIRKFIRGDEFASTEAATRISGSSDLYSHRKNGPLCSINYLNSHDGFTLHDLVSYNSKHNDENGEENRDGSDINHSYNYGFEGECSNPKIKRIRKKQIKNFLAMLFISQGVPMFVAGDEFGRSQGGNNNAYCQDNFISWIDWTLLEKNAWLFDFAQKMIELRKSSEVFRRTNFFNGKKNDSGFSDIMWHSYDGKVPDWSKLNRFLAFSLGGEFYVAINSDIHDKTVILPPCFHQKSWHRLVDTSIEDNFSALHFGNEEELTSQTRYILLSNSMIILRAK